MEFVKSDVYAYQILHYLVVKERYQIVNIQGQKQDFWLMNAKKNDFPIIRICNDTNAEVYDAQDYMRNIQRAILDIMKLEGKICIFNTNEDCTPFHNEYMIQYKLVPDVAKDVVIERVFSGIYDCIHDVEDAQSECASLMRAMEVSEMKQAKARKNALNLTMPKITTAIILLCLAYYLVTQFFTYAMNDMLGGVVGTGAYYKMNVVALHEYWRLFTSGFMHLDIFHFLVNMFALFNVGIVCEKVYKRMPFLIILLSSILVGNVFVFIGDVNIISLGISGGIYGLMGAFIVYLFENGSFKHPMIRSSVMRMLMINLLISFMPQVSMLAHLGGFITGAFLGIIFIPSKKWDYLKKHVIASFGICIVFLAYFAKEVNQVYPIDKESDKMIVEAYRHVDWNAYADYTQQCYEAMYQKEEVK